MNIGLIAPESYSHVAVATNVGRSLLELGHRVTYLGFEDVRAVPEAAGLDFVAIAPREYPAGVVDRMMKQVSEARGLRSSIRTVGLLNELLDCRLRSLPDIVRGEGIDALVADQISPAASTVCELAGIPQVTVCAAVHMNYDYAVPPFFTPWSPATGPVARLRNRAGYRFFDLVRTPMRRRLNGFRERAGLSKYRGPHAGMSKLCQITQLMPAIDFAYERLPDHFRYVGPLGDMDADQSGEFPVDQLDGRPLVYCSFGTVNNSCRHLYETVLAAFANINAQLLLSLGGGDLALQTRLPKGAIVCKRVPQRRVLQHCDAFISHCGVNSALEGLYHGVPMVCVPIANDQPGVAARLAHHGAGVQLSSRGVSAQQIANAARLALFDPGYRQNAKLLQTELRGSPGVAGAAKIIDAVLSGRGLP